MLRSFLPPVSSTALVISSMNKGMPSVRSLYVWGRARFKNGFNRKRYVNFCHRYPLERMEPEPQGPGYSISAKYARYHQYGNNAD